jgi:predicted YcjX-like family ATPase
MANKIKYHTTEEKKAAKKAASTKWRKANPNRTKEIINESAVKRGFKSFTDYLKTTASYKASLKYTEPNKFKQEAILPKTAKEIPTIPGYYVTPDARIFRYSDKRKMWLEITQQTQKSLYKVFQPYINDKRTVKFVHIVMCETFISARPHGDFQVDHIDSVRGNNNIANLRWLTRSQNLARRKKWTHK